MRARPSRPQPSTLTLHCLTLTLVLPLLLAVVRTAREFGEYKLDYVVDMSSVVVRDGALHFYNLSEPEQRALEGLDLKRCCLQVRRGGVEGNVMEAGPVGWEGGAACIYYQALAMWYPLGAGAGTGDACRPSARPYVMAHRHEAPRHFPFQINSPEVHSYPLTKVFHREPLDLDTCSSTPEAGELGGRFRMCWDIPFLGKGAARSGKEGGGWMAHMHARAVRGKQYRGFCGPRPNRCTIAIRCREITLY
jgi:hypothetical protein